MHPVVTASTLSQQLLESVWKAHSIDELKEVNNRIIQNLPLCIREPSMSLVMLDTACLEACSQLDLCMCHFMNRLLHRMGGETFGTEMFTRKKTSRAQEAMFSKVIPMVGTTRVC